MEPVVDTLEVSDFDQLSELISGFQTRPIQLSRGPLKFRARRAAGGGFEVLRLALGTRIADCALVRSGIVNFTLVQAPQLWCGLEVVPPALIVHRPGHAYRSVLEPGFRSIDFSFPEDDLMPHAMGRMLVDARARLEGSFFALSHAEAAELDRAAMLVCPGESELRASDHTCALFSTTKHRVLELLHGIMARRRPPPELARCPRYRLASAALDAVDELGPTGLSPPLLAARLGVTRRALEKAFGSTLGVSPGQYLLRRRLLAVRARLIRGRGRVIDHAFSMGFQDPSRFARQYRRLFGELPSETLRASRSRGVPERTGTADLSAQRPELGPVLTTD